jgi:hypothetical protein
VNAFSGNSSAFHSNQIEPGQVSPVAHCRPKGDNITLNARHATDEGVMANAAELMDAGTAAKDDVITDFTVPGCHGIVGEDHPIANAAVMGNVGIGQKCAIVADGGHKATAFRTGVHRHAFANGAIGADFKRYPLTVILQILRLIAKGKIRV